MHNNALHCDKKERQERKRAGERERGTEGGGERGTEGEKGKVREKKREIETG